MRLHDFQRVTCHFGRLEACVWQTRKAGLERMPGPAASLQLDAPSPNHSSRSARPNLGAQLTAFFSSTATSHTWTWLAASKHHGSGQPRAVTELGAAAGLSVGPAFAFSPLPSPTGQRLAAPPERI